MPQEIQFQRDNEGRIISATASDPPPPPPVEWTWIVVVLPDGTKVTFPFGSQWFEGWPDEIKDLELCYSVVGYLGEKMKIVQVGLEQSDDEVRLASFELSGPKGRVVKVSIFGPWEMLRPKLGLLSPEQRQARREEIARKFIEQHQT